MALASPVSAAASATADGGVRRRSRRHRTLWRALAIQWAIVGLAIAAWEGVTASGLVSGYLLPTVGATASAVGGILGSSKGLHDLGVTGLELLGAFFIGAPVGIALGFGLGEFRQRRETFGSAADNLLSTLLATPKFVLLPVLVVWLGPSYWERVIYALGDGFIIMIIGTAAASFTAERQLRMVSQSLGMGKWQFFWKIYLPGALPVLVEALRLCVIFIIAGVLLAELFLSNTGIGFVIFRSGADFVLPTLYAGVVIVALMAIAINTGFRILEARLNRWRSTGATQ